jgi:hypothetical protein
MSKLPTTPPNLPLGGGIFIGTIPQPLKTSIQDELRKELLYEIALLKNISFNNGCAGYWNIKEMRER